jgi:CheY-like chemotaxis protein
MFDEKLPTEDSAGGNDSVSPRTKILLADDDASIRRFLEIILQRAGYAVTIADDGLAAMQFAVSENFDAVVADAVMPHLTGYDLCRILKQNSAYKNVRHLERHGKQCGKRLRTLHRRRLFAERRKSQTTINRNSFETSEQTSGLLKTYF